MDPSRSAKDNVCNGRLRRNDARVGPTPWGRYAEPNQILRNDGTGSFEIVAEKAGGFSDGAHVSRCLAWGDLDGDGDLDLIVTNIAGRARVFENVVEKQGRWLAVRCVDAALGRDAHGARVEVLLGDKRLSRTVANCGGYLASGGLAVHFGLGAAQPPLRVDVVWPGGERERFSVDEVDRLVILTRGEGTR